MTLQYLGTGAAEGNPGMFCYCPVCEKTRVRGGRNIRTRSQALVFAGQHGEGSHDQRLLIDLTPDTYFHYLTHDVELNKIGHMLITHSHNDHFLPSELKYRGGVYTNTPAPFKMHIYSNEKVVDMCQDFIAGAIHGTQEQYELHVVQNFETFAAGEFTVTALPALHDRRERCLNFIIEHGGKRILYGNDTGIFTQDVWDYIAGTKFDLVSLDCTFGTRPDGGNHMGMPDILEVKNRLELLDSVAEGGRIVLNHFSHNGGACYDDMVEVATPYGIEVSYDGGVWAV